MQHDSIFIHLVHRLTNLVFFYAIQHIVYNIN